MDVNEKLKGLDEIAKHYGLHNQMIKLFEELGELQTEVARYLLTGNNNEALSEEMADALIMILQVIRLTGNGDKVDGYVEHKIKRQLLRMEVEQWQ